MLSQTRKPPCCHGTGAAPSLPNGHAAEDELEGNAPSAEDGMKHLLLVTDFEKLYRFAAERALQTAPSPAASCASFSPLLGMACSISSCSIWIL